MRAAVETDLGQSPRRVARLALEAGWSVVAVTSDGPEGSALSVRGRRPGGRFAVVWFDGELEGCWWWTRRHRTLVKGYRPVRKYTKVNAWSERQTIGRMEHDPAADEWVEWTGDRPLPVKVALRELVGTEAQPARAAQPAGPTRKRAVTAREAQPAVPGLLESGADDLVGVA